MPQDILHNRSEKAWKILSREVKIVGGEDWGTREGRVQEFSEGGGVMFVRCGF